MTTNQKLYKEVSADAQYTSGERLKIFLAALGADHFQDDTSAPSNTYLLLILSIRFANTVSCALGFALLRFFNVAHRPGNRSMYAPSFL